VAIRREYSGNAAATTLTTSISNVTSTINIASATGWPTGAVGPFVTTLDAGTASEEKVLVLSRSGTALTVSTRGYDGTTATSHGLGASIIHSYSATDADEANALAAQVTTSGGTVVTTSSIPASVVTLTGTQALSNKTINGAIYGESLARNVIRNGDMGVAQRGNGTFTLTGVTTVDGWRTDFAGGTFSVTRQATVVGAGFGAAGAAWALNGVTAGQAAAGDFSQLSARVEGVRTLAGQQVTLSFLAAATSGTPKIGVEVVQSFGTGGSPSALVLTAVSAVTLSTTATRYTVTFTVPSVSGKTLGTNGDDYLQVTLWQSAGTTFAARASSIGIQNANITVTDVQLEAGGLSGFERLPQQVQLAWCQRYFVRLGNATNGRYGVGVATLTNQGNVYVQWPVTMRAIPTVAGSAGNTFLLYNGVVTGVGATLAVDTTNVTGASLFLTTATSPFAASQAVHLSQNGATASNIDASAEL